MQKLFYWIVLGFVLIIISACAQFGGGAFETGGVASIDIEQKMRVGISYDSTTKKQLERYKPWMVLESCRIKYSTGTEKQLVELNLDKSNSCWIKIDVKITGIKAFESQKAVTEASRDIADDLSKNITKGVVEGLKPGL
ncbi:MAG: hypothetical protein GWN01_02605 [Nitrosopumilaceae archaeon]|nr:hypothetical protein [Nitrosopumilaceae archaeon]NIT99858.1 hypothetical protein [Nitrosopumilaceae archaeon]NIU86221.1 hypothetical protein [Nitrosopumilaceae archaeon]NIV64982.1 hypothetical protein [Nitrosopumilaceae archaeon]NIX60461.1 hypothetical protein [Nitrosopumilaceae archaeon]